MKSRIRSAVAAAALLPPGVPFLRWLHRSSTGSQASITQNLAGGDPKGATISEIIAASEDGRLLVYTDGPRKALGFSAAPLRAGPGPRPAADPLMPRPIDQNWLAPSRG